MAPTLDVVNSINEYMSDLNSAEGRIYLSCDTIFISYSNNGILAYVHTPGPKWVASFRYT